MNAHVFDVTSSFETDIFLQLNDNDLNDAFPNVNIVLKIYLCVFVTYCKGNYSISRIDQCFVYVYTWPPLRYGRVCWFYGRKISRPVFEVY